MTMEQLSIQEGGVDEYVADGEVCMLVSVSKFQSECGRGLRSNFFNLDDCRTHPDALSNMDSVTWRRLRGGIARAKWDALCAVVPIMLVMVVPFAVLLFTMPDDATMADYPKRIKFFIAWSVLTCIVCFFALRKEKKMLNEGGQNVVSAMASQFERLGYEVEFVVEYDCYMCRCSFLRFVPAVGGRQISQEVTSAEDDLGAFNFDDWKHLEGKWEQTDRCRSYSTWYFSMRQSFEFRNESFAEGQALGAGVAEGNSSALTLGDEAAANIFVSNMKIDCRILWQHSDNASHTFTGKMVGNTNVLTNTRGEDLGDGITITPITTSGMVSCYNWASGDAALIVRGSKMLKIDFDFGDIPPASVLSSDGFLLKEGRRWVELTKTGQHDLSRNFQSSVV
jgi:hypothetical protein